MFKQLFKPKWQHPNPEVRQQALEELDASELEILQTVASGDKEPRLRCLAVRKMADLDSLYQLAEGDNNWEVKQLARQRFQSLLAGQLQPTPNLEQRLQRIDGLLQDQELCLFLLKEGKEPELRAKVLDQVKDEKLLAEVACDDNAAPLRLQAAEQVQQENLLETIAKAMRSRDKRVYRLVKERLDVLQEARERPLRLRAAREELCKRLELLLKANDWEGGDSAAEHPELQRLQTQWQAIDGEAEAEQAAQFQQLYQNCLDAWVHYQTEKQARSSLRNAKQGLFGGLQAIENELQQAQRIKTEQARELGEQIDALNRDWQRLDKLPEQEEQSFYSQFNQSYHHARSRLKELQHHTQIAEALEKICRKAERKVKDHKAVQRDTVKKLEQSWQAVERVPGAQGLVNPLQQRFSKAVDTLRKRRETQVAERETHLQQLQKNLDDLGRLLGEGHLHEAKPLAEDAQRLLRQLELTKAQQHEMESRLHEAQAKIRELDSWQRWGNTREREQLCELAEELAKSQDNPEAIARQIQEAQAEWQKLSHQDHSNALWQRFHDACQKAYEPCRAYFDQQAQERQENLHKREAVCEELARIERETDWKHPLDWRAVYQQIQAQRKLWFKLGPTDRKQRRQVNQRFDALLEQLDTHLERERQRNFHQRQELVNTARGLLEAEDLYAATEQIKQLQKDWHITVPASRKDERTIWKDFHSACDAVFERQRAQRRSHEDEQQQNLEAKNALCAQLEQLAEQGGEALLEAGAHLHKAESEWAALGMVPKKALRGVEKRFDKARQALRHARADFLAARARDQLAHLQARGEFCARLESLPLEQRATEQAAWEALPDLEDDTLAAALEQRFQAALAGGGDLDATALREQLQALCLRMELAAGIDSPQEFAQARMAYQVERLSKAMTGDKLEANDSPHAEGARIIRDWYLSKQAGALEDYAQLEARFAKARDAWYQTEQKD